MTAVPEPRRPDDQTSDVIAQLAELLACTSWRLRRASRRELEPLGLTFGQARALRLLARAGEPVRIGELAARLEVVPRSATTMVDALEIAGLAGRQAAPDDRRSVLVGLTADGEALLERLGRIAPRINFHLVPSPERYKNYVYIPFKILGQCNLLLQKVRPFYYRKFHRKPLFS